MPRLRWWLILAAASAFAQQAPPETKVPPQAKPEPPKTFRHLPYWPRLFPIVIAPCTVFPDNPVFVIDSGKITIIKVKDLEPIPSIPPSIDTPAPSLQK